MADVNTNHICFCSYNHEYDTTVSCDGCDQWFHAMCCNYQPLSSQQEFYCPLCLCEREISSVTNQITAIVNKYVSPSLKPVFRTMNNKEEEVSVYHTERKRRRGVDDEEYSGVSDYKKRLRNENSMKRRKSERLSEKGPQETEPILQEKRMEEPLPRVKYSRTPNALGDVEMNNFLKLFLHNPRLYNTQKWIIDCVSNKNNNGSLKVLNPCRVDNETEWMERVKSILLNLDELADVEGMVKQQTLPAPIQFLFFEYLRLSLGDNPDTTAVLQLFAGFVWYRSLYITLQTTREVSFWKRLLELAKQLEISHQPLLDFVDSVGVSGKYYQ